MPTTQSKMGQKDLKRLVGELPYIHLPVPGVVAHCFHIQCALNQGGVYRVWLSLAFHRELSYWNDLPLRAESRLTHLAEIVCWEPTHLEFCAASGLG